MTEVVKVEYGQLNLGTLPTSTTGSQFLACLGTIYFEMF